MSPYTAQLTLPRFDESKRYASFYDLQARSFRAEKLTAEQFSLLYGPWATIMDEAG